MATNLEALARCDRYEVSPEVGFKNQFMIAAAGGTSVSGMAECMIGKWTVHYGSAVAIFPMIDDKDRVFGAFIGIGVDSEGEFVDAECFSRFNSKGRSFETDFEAYVGGIAGRYAVLLDTGTKTRIYLDPMAHMAVFYNTETRLAASSLFLTIERAVDPDPLAMKPVNEPDKATEVMPLGRSPDRDVRLVPGNHMLDLTDFVPKRVWPLRNTIRKVTAAKARPVIEKMAARLSAVVGALVNARETILPLDGGAGSRIVLAATGTRRTELAQIYSIDWTGEDAGGDAAVAAMLCDGLGLVHTVLYREAARAKFGRSRPARQHSKRLYWLRTSCAFRAPREMTSNVTGLRPEGDLVLDATGAEALQCGRQVGTEAQAAISSRSGLKGEIAVAIGRSVDKEDLAALSDDYGAWKVSLPKTLQPLITDFMRLELHQPARAVEFYGHGDNFTVSPFSDRTLIELALKLPAGMRGGPKLAEALIAALEPALSGLPYRGDLTLAEAAE